MIFLGQLQITIFFQVCMFACTQLRCHSSFAITPVYYTVKFFLANLDNITSVIHNLKFNREKSEYFLCNYIFHK